jgi:glycine betaine/proline transport system substrate-binding protein
MRIGLRLTAALLFGSHSFAAAQTAPSTAAGAAEPAAIVIGAPSWPSAQATANIIRVVLEDRLGLTAEIAPMSNDEIFVGMDGGSVDVHPEVWQPNLDALRKAYVDERGSVRESPRTVEASQNLCTTREAAEKLGLRSVADLARRSTAALFDTDFDTKGEMWIGDPSWTSTQVEKIRARSYGYDATMTLLEAPEDVAMASIDASIAVGRPVVFYCYRPHHLFALHDVVALEEPEHDPAKWRVVLPAEDPDWLAKSSAPVAWSRSQFRIAYATALEESAPEAARLLDAIALDADTISQMSYAIAVERKEPYAFAKEWVAAHGDRVDTWVKEAKQ